tara:strand:+ start:521 stop:862 length:342 start_codon:yes stop_codon:yes gene_type:complete
MSSNWIPEIMYEENEDGTSSHIPFVMVPADQTMPTLLYVFESRETGEFEPGLEGDDVPVVQWDLHQYADMAILKEGLDPITYDVVRSALGLEPLDAAAEKGREISQQIRDKVE